jgi:hypothetical protein
MNDVAFCLTFVITITSTYFNRHNDLEDYLESYNDEFEDAVRLNREIQEVFNFIDACELDSRSRAWQKADLLTLLVETHRALIKEGRDLSSEIIGTKLVEFYERVNRALRGEVDEASITEDHRAAIQAPNDRSSRITRGRIGGRKSLARERFWQELEDDDGLPQAQAGAAQPPRPGNDTVQARTPAQLKALAGDLGFGMARWTSRRLAS